MALLTDLVSGACECAKHLALSSRDIIIPSAACRKELQTKLIRTVSLSRISSKASLLNDGYSSFTESEPSPTGFSQISPLQNRSPETEQIQKIPSDCDEEAESLFHELKLMYIEPWYARRLFQSSCFLAVPFVLSVVLAVWDCALLSAAVFLTSLNHWRRPRICIRRSVDLVTVEIAFIYHVYLAVMESREPGGRWWLLCCVVGGVCYLLGRVHGNRGDHHKGSLFHMALHSIGVAGNLGLYATLAVRRRSSDYVTGGIPDVTDSDKRFATFTSIAFAVGAIGIACRYLEPAHQDLRDVEHCLASPSSPNDVSANRSATAHAAFLSATAPTEALAASATAATGDPQPPLQQRAAVAAASAKTSAD